MRKPNESQSEADERSQNFKKFGLFSVILTDLIAYSGAGFGLGYLAWSKLGAPWWVLLIFSLTGLSLAFYKLYQISQKEL